MEQKLLSIYVGNEVTRVCEVIKKSSSMIVVNNATEVETPMGSMDDGYLTDVPAIAEAIRGCIFGRGYSANKVIFTIASKKIANKEVVIPYVRGDKKIASILEANSGEYFPMSTTGDFLFAHTIMETFQDGAEKKLRLTAVAAPRDLVECYYELADELRYTVEDIDYVGNSVLQLLSLQMKDNDTELVLQIEKDMTFVNVMSGKSVILQRSVPYGKNAVINSMMEIKKLTEKEAKNLLSDRELLDRQVTEEEYAEAVRYLISSIGRIVEYHRSRNPERIIDGIRVFGEGSSIAGIDDVLRQELGAHVTHFSTLQGVKVGNKSYLTSETALRYLANFGAVLNPIGLSLNRSKSKDNASKTADLILYIVLALALVVVVTWTVITMVAYYGKVAEREYYTVQIASMEDVEQIKAEYEAAKGAFELVDAFSQSTNSNNEMVLQFINDLERILPTTMIINEFSSAGGAVEFTVTAPNKEAVADMIVEMRKLDYVSSFEIPSFEEEVGVIPTNEVEEETEVTEEEEEEEELLDEFGDPIPLTVVTYQFSCTLVKPAEVEAEGGVQ